MVNGPNQSPLPVETLEVRVALLLARIRDIATLSYGAPNGVIRGEIHGGAHILWYDLPVDDQVRAHGCIAYRARSGPFDELAMLVVDLPADHPLGVRGGAVRVGSDPFDSFAVDNPQPDPVDGLMAPFIDEQRAAIEITMGDDPLELFLTGQDVAHARTLVDLLAQSAAPNPQAQ